MTTESGLANSAEREQNRSWPEQDDLGSIFPTSGSDFAGAIALICLTLAFSLF